MSNERGLSWIGIVRLGLVQTSLGAIVVLTTSTLNRVMVVELMMPALLPGALVALHYAVQLARPRFGHGSDNGRRRTPWIIGGIGILGLGGVLAAVATAWMATAPAAGMLLAVAAFVLIGAGVGASGTCLLVLLASSVAPERRAAAASITWIMMIAGFAITAGVVGAFLDPFSLTKLIVASTIVAAIALFVTILALAGLERRYCPAGIASDAERPQQVRFFDALRDVVREDHTRRFGIFVFVSMLAYSAQDLILEPFAGAVFALTPGESTQLGGIQHSGVLLGMLVIAFVGRKATQHRSRILQQSVAAGCVGSAGMLAALSIAGFVGPEWPLAATVFALGLANGAFAVAAIGSMMALVSQGRKQSDGLRMGVWGAAQAIAFAIGGIAGTGAVDIIRWLSGSVLHAYSLVFFAQAILFAYAALLASRLWRHDRASTMNLAPEAGTGR